jgi:hypothetical protein
MSGIFGLSGAYDRNLSGLIPEKTRPTFREYGYFGGGEGPTCRVERIDYSNDTNTTNVRGSLSTAKRSIAATGNSNFGYFSGNDLDRIDYSNDNQNASIRGTLSIVRGQLAATGNSNFGYFGGGAPGPKSTIDRVNYLNDLITASPRGGLQTARSTLAATGNSNFGYFGGGEPLGTSIVDRLSYANDFSNTLRRGYLSENRAYINNNATGNSNFGYFMGGFFVSEKSKIDRIDYSNDLIDASPRGSLIYTVYFSSATGNSNFGYLAGGKSSTKISTTSRVDYSNDTVTASLRGPLSAGNAYHAPTSSHSFGGAPNSQYGVFAKYPYGYFIGGSFNGAAAGAKVNRLSFDNDTANASERGSLTNNVAGGAAVSSSNYFYSISGYSASGGALSFVERQDFSNDTSTATVRSRTSLARGDLAAEGNSSYGWIGGGGPNFGAFPYYSTIDRIDYSNDSVNARLRSFLTLARLRTSATGTSNFGYFGAGSFSTASPFLTKRVDRLNHSNDTINPLIRGDLFTLATKRAGTGTANFGYFGGGYSVGGSGAQTSAIDRIDYSNDTATAIQRASILVGRGGIGATGDNNKGYFGGGDQYANGFPYYSTIERLDYSNDTQTQLRSILYDNPVFGQPSLGRTNLSATSALEFGGAKDFQATQTFFDIQSVKSISDTTNYSVKKRALGSFGYFGGGVAGPKRSTVDRIDYSNDSAKGSVRGPLLGGTYKGSAAGNSNFGYYLGGFDATWVTFAQRIDYSNDLATPNNRITVGFPDRIYRACSAGNENEGIFGGAYQGILKRIDYSNDTSLIKKGTVNIRYNASGTGNNNFAYFGGGNFPGPNLIFSSVDRISYSNSLSKSLIRGPLSVARISLAASSNSNFGYFAGGWITTPTVVYYNRIERIDYSNDTAASSIRSIIPTALVNSAGTGNSDFGYFSNGLTVYRVDYFNDTTTASIRGNLSLGRGGLTATTNARNS